MKIIDPRHYPRDKRLTEAQQYALDVIRTLGGTITRVFPKFQWFAPGEPEPIGGLNMVAIRSLIRKGLLRIESTENADIYYTPGSR